MRLTNNVTDLNHKTASFLTYVLDNQRYEESINLQLEDCQGFKFGMEMSLSMDAKSLTEGTLRLLWIVEFEI